MGKVMIPKYDLRLCPSCKGEPSFVTSFELDGNVRYEVGCIQCTNCGIQTPSLCIDGYYGDPTTTDDIADIWNGKLTIKEYHETFHKRWEEKNERDQAFLKKRFGSNQNIQDSQTSGKVKKPYESPKVEIIEKPNIFASACQREVE